MARDDGSQSALAQPRARSRSGRRIVGGRLLAALDDHHDDSAREGRGTDDVAATSADEPGPQLLGEGLEIRLDDLHREFRASSDVVEWSAVDPQRERKLL